MSIVDFYNSFTTFGVLAAIAFGILLLVAKKDTSSNKSSKKR